MGAVDYESFSEHFNPRPPCGGRQSTRLERELAELFQSTPPVWGATSELCHRQLLPLKFQSTPPVWGATGDTMLLMASVMQFQSTPPVWGATGTLHTQGRAGASISIHAPRVGGDYTSPCGTTLG